MKEGALRDIQIGSIEKSSRITSRQILCTKLRECHDTEGHFTDARIAREGDLHE